MRRAGVSAPSAGGAPRSTSGTSAKAARLALRTPSAAVVMAASSVRDEPSDTASWARSAPSISSIT